MKEINRIRLYRAFHDENTHREIRVVVEIDEATPEIQNAVSDEYEKFCKEVLELQNPPFADREVGAR